jgi:predicted Ser/Thr protein kinase
MEYGGKSVTFDRKAVLGKGATAVVFSGTWGNQNVAIKRGELPKFNVREESTMKAIGHHENVIDCFGILKDCDFM